MATDKAYHEFIMEQLQEAEGIASRAMMGEYVLYCKGKVVGGIYDDRVLVKPTSSALSLMPDAERQIPYEGAKELLLVDNLEDRLFLKTLFEAIADDLPSKGRKK